MCLINAKFTYLKEEEEAEGGTTEENKEPTHHSELDPKTMKVGLNIVKGLKGGCSSIKYLVYLNVNYYYSEGLKVRKIFITQTFIPK